MGYSFDMQNRLCCDNCGQSGNVRKMKCPWNYCHADAVCPKCKIEKKDHLSKVAHRNRGCERNHNAYMLDLANEKALLDKGEYLRSCARGFGDMVKAIFTNKDRQDQAFWMSTKTYHAISLGVHATADDFRAHGILLDAVNTDINDGEHYAESKEVA